MSEPLLSGVKVLELGQRVAAPYCSRLLALMGADVIKVERPGFGDSARRVGPFPGDIPHPEKSGLYLYLNTNKKGITLDLKAAAGRNLLKRLVAEWADIVVENFRPSFLPSLGLGYEDLAALKKGVIVTSITNFGQTGPYRDFEAEDIGIQALGGMMYITGEPSREPLKQGGYQSEYLGGAYGVVGSLTALYHRNVSGEGQHVDISLQDAMAFGHEYTFTVYGYQQQVMNRLGNRWLGWPWGLYFCKDGYFGITLRREWQQFVELLGAEDLKDPRWANSQERYLNSDLMDALSMPYLMEWKKKDFYYTMQDHGVPVGYSATAEDLLEDRQLLARKYFQNVDFPEAGPLPTAGVPWRTDDDEQLSLEPAPLLGEFNEYVYRGILGLSNPELVTLRRQGAI